MTREYEFLFLTTVNEAAFNNAKNRVKEVFAENGGTVTGEEDMGVRRLAYDISGNRDGHYFVYYVTISPEGIKASEKALSIEDVYLRSLTTVIDKKHKAYLEARAKKQG